MSGYKRFDRCVICRSKQNLENYMGKFETTMLINSLYLTVLHCIETRELFIANYADFYKWLCDYCHINTCGNKFTKKKTLQNLRNGLAHFNIKTFEHDNEISRIKIWVCRWSKRDENYKVFTDDEVDKAICVFDFSVDQLRTYAEHIAGVTLDFISDDVCANCPYKTEEE